MLFTNRACATTNDPVKGQRVWYSSGGTRGAGIIRSIGFFRVGQRVAARSVAEWLMAYILWARVRERKKTHAEQDNMRTSVRFND